MLYEPTQLVELTLGTLFKRNSSQLLGVSFLTD